jgi:hypothetical protein
VGLELALVLVAACGGPKLVAQVTEYPGGFGPHGTYRWARPPVESVPGQPASLALRTDWAVREAVQQGLAKKGWRGPQAGPADVVLAYDIRLRTATADTFTEFLDYKRAGGKKDFGEAYMDGFEEATLTLQAADGADRVVWQGEVTGVTDPARSGKKIPQAVGALLDRFPDGG